MISKKRSVVLTVGTFDGIHLGHRKIIQLLVEKAEEKKCVPVVLSLGRPARSIIKNQLHDLITPWKEKVERLKGLGVKKVEKIRFSSDFRRLSPEDFIFSFLFRKFDVRGIAAGEDFRFGRGKKGNVRLLKDICGGRGISVWAVKKKKFHNRVISSTRIREEVSAGNIEAANSMLGYNFSISGAVYRGQGLGKRLGVPTLNIKADRHKMLPTGVFRALLDGRKAVCNIGCRPTVSRRRVEKTIEAHVVDSAAGINKNKVTLELLGKIRDEKKFRSLEDLKSQILADISKE